MDNQQYVQETRRRHAMHVQQLERLKREMSDLERRIQAEEEAVNLYAGVARLEEATPQEPASLNGVAHALLGQSPKSAYHDKKIEDMLATYADSLGKPIGVTPAAKEFVRVGLWPDVKRARDSIHPTMRALVKRGSWRKIGAGRQATYERVQPDNLTALREPPERQPVSESSAA
jgi:hypothetical protein